MHRRSFLGYALGAVGVAVITTSTKLAIAAPASAEDAGAPAKDAAQVEGQASGLQRDEVGAQWRRRWGWRRRRRYWRRRWAW